MIGDLDHSLVMIFGEEGGYLSPEEAERQGDPGGETKYGISKRQYPHLNIKELTIEQAAEIYRSDYWIPVKGDELPWPLCLYVFDAAVNQGVEAAVGLLQKTLNLKRDGILGPVTLEAAKRADQNTMALYMSDRALRYTGTRNADRFLRGWLKRLFVISMSSHNG